MELREYGRIISRISPHAAEDLDDLLAPGSGRARRQGAVVFPEIEASLAPQMAFRRADAVCVGFRVAPGGGPAADRAVRFAAMAIERDVDVVVLAEEDVCGLERFGFRVERIAGEASRAACIEQIRRFWALDLVVGA